MDKTIKVNLAGSLFNIDENAYKILRDYREGNPFIDKYIFKNLSTEDRNKFMDNLLYVDKATYGVKLAKDISYENNPSYFFTGGASAHLGSSCIMGKIQK